MFDIRYDGVQEEYMSKKDLSKQQLADELQALKAAQEQLSLENHALVEKALELSGTATDLENLQASIELPLIVVGQDGLVKRYVNAIFDLLENGRVDIGDAITDLKWKSPIPRLLEYIEQVMDEGTRYRQRVHIAEAYYQLYITPYFDNDYQIQGVIIFFTDVTNSTLARQELKKEREMAHMTLEHISDCVIRVDTNMMIDYMNPAAEVLCGWSERAVIGKPLKAIIELLDEESRDSVLPGFACGISMEKTKVARLIKGKSQQAIVEYICTTITDEQSECIGLLLVLRDVSENRAAMKRLMWQSSHDHLTGLANRYEVEKRLTESIRLARHGQPAVFMFVDLDQFKIVNDTCGHFAGDELLRRITQQVVRQLRDEDIVARLGGDEFGILLDNCSIEEGCRTAHTICDVIANYRFIWDEKLFKISASIGLLEIDGETENTNQLLRDADSASYKVKTHGGNGFQVHRDSDIELTEKKQQLSMVADLNHALENQRLQLYFQPVVCSRTDKIVYWEVLVRLMSRDNELLMPQEFLPASERFGLIRQIDAWVIFNVTRHLNELFNQVKNCPQVAINLSAATLADKACDKKLISIFHQYPQLRNHIRFEITETSALSNIDSINMMIQQLREYGCSLALDDFGTGVSTYSYLRQLDVDMIKIDGEFIRDITTNKVNQEIVKSIVHIAQLMDISVTAEWVDSDPVYLYLANVGVDCLQGNYLGQPLSLEDFSHYIRETDAPIATRKISPTTEA